MNNENVIVNYVIQTLILENNLRIRYIYIYIPFDKNTLLKLWKTYLENMILQNNYYGLWIILQTFENIQYI
jgi:hypothetical protein